MNPSEKDKYLESYQEPPSTYLDSLAVGNPAVHRNLGSSLAPIAAGCGGGSGGAGTIRRRRGMQLLVFHGNHPGDQTGQERQVKAEVMETA